MDLIKQFLVFYETNQRLARRVMETLLDAGFTYCLVNNKGKVSEIQDLMRQDFKKNKKKISKLITGHCLEKGGLIDIRNHDKTFIRAFYSPGGDVRYQFGDDEQSALDALQQNKEFFLDIRNHAEEFLDEDFLSDMATLICGFFSTMDEGGYKLQGQFGKDRVTKGEWRSNSLLIEVEKMDVFFNFAIIALHGLDYGKASIKNALDLMKFFTKIQRGVKNLSEVLSLEGYRLEVSCAGDLLFRTGQKVKPSPTDALGNTEVRIDNILTAVTSGLKR